MGKNENKRNNRSTNEIDLSKNGVYCNGLMLKTVFIIIILNIKKYKNILLATLIELKHGMYQGYDGLPRTA